MRGESERGKARCAHCAVEHATERRDEQVATHVGESGDEGSVCRTGGNRL